MEEQAECYVPNQTNREYMHPYAFLAGVSLFVMTVFGVSWLLFQRWKSKCQELALCPEELEYQVENERICEIIVYLNSLPKVPDKFVGEEEQEQKPRQMAGTCGQSGEHESQSFVEPVRPLRKHDDPVGASAGSESPKAEEQGQKQQHDRCNGTPLNRSATMTACFACNADDVLKSARRRVRRTHAVVCFRCSMFEPTSDVLRAGASTLEGRTSVNVDMFAHMNAQ